MILHDADKPQRTESSPGESQNAFPPSIPSKTNADEHRCTPKLVLFLSPNPVQPSRSSSSAMDFPDFNPDIEYAQVPSSSLRVELIGLLVRMILSWLKNSTNSIMIDCDSEMDSIEIKLPNALKLGCTC